LEQFGLPSFMLMLSATEKTIKERFCKKNEVEEVPEEAVEELKQQEAADVALSAEIENAYSTPPIRVRVIPLETNSSLETTGNELTK
jgi:hypothetical protein